MTINHLTLLLPRSQFPQLLNWYVKTLAPLDYAIQLGPFGPDNWIGMGPHGGLACFWLKASGQTIPMHIAFDAISNERVRQFYDIGIREGGSPNGKPGIREEMSRQPYYSAFVIDPAGNNIEAKNPLRPRERDSSTRTPIHPQARIAGENEHLGPPEVHRITTSVTGSSVAGPSSPPSENLDNEPMATAATAPTGNNHVGHERLLTNLEMDSLVNYFSLQLTQQPTIPPLARHSMEFILRVLRTWPGMMANDFQPPPIIHTSQMSKNPLSLPLANCFTVAKMWDGQLSGAEELVSRTAMNEMIRLFVEYQSYDEFNLVAALQAAVIYMIILIFPKRENVYVMNLDVSIINNIQQMVYAVAQTGLVMQEERDHVRPSWESWVHFTSKRRTLLALYLLHWSYGLLNSIPSFDCHELVFMPAPAAKSLWQISRKEEWEPLYDRWLIRWEGGAYIQQEFWEIEPGLMINSRTQKWLEEADEFGLMLMSLVNATDKQPDLTSGTL
ncbi:hypothetical protein V1522DRAFT_372421 [Lipomyces starkeyi]